MTKPTYEEMLSGNTRWRSEHEGVGIELSFHGYLPREKREYYDYGHGTWCYYLILDERMFYPKDWKKLCLKATKGKYGLDYNYYRFPEVEFHCGITFYEVNKHYDHKTGEDYRTVKAGCDYNHLWDKEAGYNDTYESVLFDAKYSARKLLQLFPEVKRRCKYSGIWDDAENFYLAKNGCLVHNTMQDKLREDNWEAWLP